MGFIFPRGKFSRNRPYREKRENYPHAKISVQFTVLPITLMLKAGANSFKRFTSRLLKVSFSLYAPITSDECHP